MAHTMEKQETELVEVRQLWPPTPLPEPARRPAPPIPNEIYNYKLVLLAVTAASAATIIGYDSGFIGGTVSLDSFKDEFGLNELLSLKQSQISSNVVSVFRPERILAACSSTLSASFLEDEWGFFFWDSCSRSAPPSRLF